MQPPLQKRVLDFISVPSNRERLLGGVFLYLSLLFGLKGGGLSLPGWIIFGIIGFAFIYRATPNFFFITWSLILIYLITFLGVYIYFAPEIGLFTGYLKPMGVVLVLLSFTLTSRFILYFKDLRDLIAMDGRYVPLGLFSVSALLFFILSLLSSYGWARWGTGGGGLALYTVSECLLIPSMLYLYYFPEMRLKAVKEEGEPPPWAERVLRLAITLPRILPPPRCPHCGRGMIRERRRCPGCGREANVLRCPGTRTIYKRCTECGGLTPLTRLTCIHCGAEVDERITCPWCGHAYPHHLWEAS